MFEIRPLSALKEQRTVKLSAELLWQFRGNQPSNLVLTNTTGLGSVTYNNGMAVLQTGATANSAALMKTINNLVPTPGLGILVRFGVIFSPGTANSVQLIGLGNEASGYFFGYNGISFGILLRQQGVDTWTPKADWNGEGTEGYKVSDTIDPTKGNIFSINLQALGFGNIMFSIIDPISGESIIVHTVRCLNTAPFSYSFDVNLPLMAEVMNETNSSNVFLKTPSAGVFMEGETSIVKDENEAARLGILYTALTGSRTVPSNGFLCLQLINPAASGRTIYLSNLSSSAAINTTLDLIRDGSFTVAGSTIIPRNTNFFQTDASIVQAKWISQATDPVISGVLVNSAIQAGGPVQTDFKGAIVLPPNHTVAARLANNDSKEAKLSLGITYWEVVE